MLNNIFQVFKKQKKFINSVAKKFVDVFTKQTAKLIHLIKVRKERQKAMFLQLFAYFNKLKLYNFFNKNRKSIKMTNIKVAIVAKTDKLQANCRVAKDFQIREKYKVKLIILNAKYFSLLSISLLLF